MRERHPQLPWRAIMGAGNMCRHDYDNVVQELVWRTLQDSLGPLLVVVESEIAGLSKLKADTAAPGWVLSAWSNVV